MDLEEEAIKRARELSPKSLCFVEGRYKQDENGISVLTIKASGPVSGDTPIMFDERSGGLKSASDARYEVKLKDGKIISFTELE